jgi:hypothetical protein
MFEGDTKNNSALLQQTDNDLVYLPKVINKAKEEENDSFRKWQEDLLTNPNQAEESYKNYESKKRQREKLEDKQRALEGIKPKLKTSIFESKNLEKKEIQQRCVSRGGKSLGKLFNIINKAAFEVFKEVAVIVEGIENNCQVKEVKSWRGQMVRCKIDPNKGKALMGTHAYHPPAEVRKRIDEPFDVRLEVREEDKAVFINMSVGSALEAQAAGEVEIMDDLERVPFELETRYSPLPEMYDILNSLRLFLIPGNGLSPELQEYVEKQIPLTVFNVGRLMSESEKTALLKKILEGE